MLINSRCDQWFHPCSHGRGIALKHCFQRSDQRLRLTLSFTEQISRARLSPHITQRQSGHRVIDSEPSPALNSSVHGLDFQHDTPGH